MMIINADHSFKKEWVKKLKLIPLDNNLKDTYSELTAASTKTALP